MEAALMSVQPVSPAKIESELTKLWESLRGANKIRASLFNLIFYTQKTHRAGYVHKIAQKVVEKFPARIIFITVDKEAKEDRCATSISVLATKTGQTEILCDYIAIDASGKGVEQIPFLLYPQIIPDLPVYLIWAENPITDNPLALHCDQFVTRVIYDSECTDNLPAFAKAVLASKQEIADLNWARTESWRNLLCAVFNTPEKLADLNTAKTITLTYNAQASEFFCHTEIQAIYLQAWLAAQLQWTPKPRLHYQGPQGDIAVVLKPVSHTNLPPGLVLTVDIATAEKQFTFIRDLQKTQQITVEISTKELCELPTKYLFSKGESGQSLVREICHKGTSSHYLNVLNLVSKYESLG